MSSSNQRWVARAASVVLLVDDDPFQAQARKSVLEKRFSGVERVNDAAQAFIRIGSSEETPSLVIVALDQPGFTGPAFVDELVRRLPNIPILVLGRPGESFREYNGKRVRFLPRPSSTEALLALSCDMISSVRPHVA